MDAKLLQLVDTIQHESTKHVVSTIISEFKKRRTRLVCNSKKMRIFAQSWKRVYGNMKDTRVRTSTSVDNPSFNPNVDDDALLERIVFCIEKFLR